MPPIFLPFFSGIQLHKRFVDAVAHLGIKNAVPKTIMQLMNVEGLTRLVGSLGLLPVSQVCVVSHPACMPCDSRG